MRSTYNTAHVGPLSPRTASLSCAAILTAASFWFVAPEDSLAQEPPVVQQAKTAAALVESETRAFEAAASRVQDSVLQVETFFLASDGGNKLASTTTSATIVGENGLAIASLFSFSEDPASTLVRFPDGSRQPANIIARDYSRELVLLQIEGFTGRVPEFASEASLEVGQWAIALGKTYDATIASRSIGIVSALGRAYGKAVQTDAKVSPINYGGPLVDIRGQVIGFLTPLSPGAFLEGDSSELYDSGIGFAVPAEQVVQRLKRLASGEDIHKGLLGVVVKDKNELVGPVELTGTAPGSPAAKAGLKAGDIIVEANGTTIHRYGELKHAIAMRDAGQTIQIVVTREGTRIPIECGLAKTVPLYRKRVLGLQLLGVASSEGSDAELQASKTSQLLIVDVPQGSPAANAGIGPGGYLTGAFGEPNPTIQFLHERLAVAELDAPIEVEWQTKQGDAKAARLLPTEWSPATSLPQPVYEAGEAKCTVSELKLNDKPNACFAIVPPRQRLQLVGDKQHMIDNLNLGVLLVLPRPGEVKAEASLEYWNQFCIDHGWIVAVINSQDEKKWTREELDIPGRILKRIEDRFPVDPLRRVLAGIGPGGQLAFLANSEMEGISGVSLFSASLPPFGLRIRNAPGETLSFLFAGEQKLVEPPFQTLNKAGFPAQAITLDKQISGWNDLPREAFETWLVGLGVL